MTNEEMWDELRKRKAAHPRSAKLAVCGGGSGMKAFCPFCEKEYNNLEAQTRYEITTLNGVTAEWQKKYIVCPDCGEDLYNGELHNANLRVLYAACKVSDIDKPVEDLCDYVLKLRMENAELRERLDNAGKFPCKVGDTIYQTDTNGTRVFKSTVKNIIFETDGVAFDDRAIGESIFLTEEAVKEKMKELQGGEKQ